MIWSLPLRRCLRLLPVVVLVLLLLALFADRHSLSPAYAAAECAVDASEEVLDGEEQQMLAQINQYRQQSGAAPLTPSVGLTRAAAWMSLDMATKGYFDHKDSLGRSPFDRMERCGYSSTAMGENVGRAFGYNAGTVEIIFNGWRNSPSHDAAMRNVTYRAAGVARSCSGNGCYWTLDLGAQLDAALTETAPAPKPATPVPPVVVQPLATTVTQAVAVQTPVATSRDGGAVTGLAAIPVTPVTKPNIVQANPAPAARPAESIAPIRGWLNAPVGHPASRNACPAPGTWTVLYWNGIPSDIATAAALCPAGDRFWVVQRGQWLGLNPRDIHQSDRWTVQPGEAVFVHAP